MKTDTLLSSSIEPMILGNYLVLRLWSLEKKKQEKKEGGEGGWGIDWTKVWKTAQQNLPLHSPQWFFSSTDKQAYIYTHTDNKPTGLTQICYKWSVE